MTDNKTKQTTKAQRAASARYQKKAVRFYAKKSPDSEEGKLLQKAKDSGTLNEKFWAFLRKEYGN
ncbi:hypothetical protein KRX19_05790 [Cardiobacteriaceae bacterium TAE3-ERU3]|nr:hypothetical protein [Cardiobacteriaceae bacterium TAE3-ERU3]